MAKIKMNKIITTLGVTVTVFFSSVSTGWSGDFFKGVAAYKAGNYAIALQEWKPLAEKGHVSAQYNLSLMYALGHGIIQDHVYAHLWSNIAASSGHKNATANRDVIAKRMSASQLEKAQELARECVKKQYKGC